jgi:phosphoribosyl-AMP cyclohydrolase
MISEKAIADTLAALAFNTDGLVCAVAQDHATNDVLMVAWMNADSVRETLASGQVCYWSRSRGRRWRKGETSGQTQRLISFRIDCDGDTVLLKVEQTGAACHTGRRTCFYREAGPESLNTIADVMVDPKTLYGS